MKVAAIAIGRNEGDRLHACLHSLKAQADRVIYVDSGSTDGSVAFARSLGADVVALDMTLPFTAARARNAGFAQVDPAETPLVQFVDGDCALQEGWIDTARAALLAAPGVGVVCGRRRERHPERSVYNHLIDIEWDTPIGEALACGGDALCRAEAIAAVGGFDPSLIAGEEPEMCLRLRRDGWKILRIDAGMTLHDAAITRFSQWWKRSRRAGHAFAEGASMHGGTPERHWVRETRRAVVWGAAIPLATLLAAAVQPLFLFAFALYPLQVLRLSRQGWQWAFFNVLGKFAEAQGVAQFYLSRLFGRRSGIVEYK